jgi:hypothetical protein
MSLNAWDENGTLGVSVCYRPEAFTEKRAEDTSALLGSILRNMVESPEMRVATFKKRNAVFSL